MYVLNIFIYLFLYNFISILLFWSSFFLVRNPRLPISEWITHVCSSCDSPDYSPLPLGFFFTFWFLDSCFVIFLNLKTFKKKKPSRSYFALVVFALCLQEHRLKYCVHLYLQAVYHQECSANELVGLDCSSRFTSGVFRLCIHIWLLLCNIFDV